MPATYATGITVDSNGYGTGSFVTAFRGFIAKFYPVTSNTGPYLAACTYPGGKTGNTSDFLSGIAVDSSGYVGVVGYSNSADFPVTSGAYGTVCGPGGGTCAAAQVKGTNLSTVTGSARICPPA